MKFYHISANSDDYYEDGIRKTVSLRQGEVTLKEFQEYCEIFTKNALRNIYDICARLCTLCAYLGDYSLCIVSDNCYYCLHILRFLSETFCSQLGISIIANPITTLCAGR